MTDEELVARLRSGLDNADRGADGIRELGGVVLTMNQGADRIEELGVALREILYAVEEEDQQRLAWALQIARDVNGR